MTVFRWYRTEKEHKRWAATLRGMRRYVIGQGLLGWGLIIFLVMACGPAFLGFPYRADPSNYYWLRQSVLWAAAGLAYGLATWPGCELMYRKHATSDP